MVITVSMPRKWREEGSTGILAQSIPLDVSSRLPVGYGICHGITALDESPFVSCNVWKRTYAIPPVIYAAFKAT